MNEKFLSRGKREDNGEWVEGSLVFTNIIIPNTIDNMFFHYINAKDSMTLGTGKYLTKDSMLKFYIVAPETVGRCTGLTDKNGKMIFEGDIVKGVVLSSEFIGDIVWIEEIASFGIGHRGKREPTAWENSSLFKRLRLGYKDQFAAEIIGNIHDNPELIGGAE